MKHKLEQFFEFSKNQTHLKIEVIAGMTTFLATMYIIVVNPMILAEAGLPFNAVLTATILVSAISSIFMGIYAKNPIVLAPGMGMNAFFCYTVVQGMQVPAEVALGAVFWSGVIFVLLSILNVRTLIVQAIPKQLRYGIAAGIGIFICVIGLSNAKFIVSGGATLVSPGKLDEITITFVIGLLISAILVARQIKGALIIGILTTTLLSIPIGRLWGDASSAIGSTTLITWKGLFAAPDFSLIFRLDLWHSLKIALWPVIFSLLFTDMFDSLSTFIGVAEAADILDEQGEPRNIRESLIVDGFSTMISGLLGSSPGTSYIESAAGIEEGGRSGFTAVVAGVLFLPFMFFSPLLGMVPSIATAPALVLVGVFMIEPVTKIHWEKFDDAIPAFLALILIPLTYSITQGIIWGFLSWTIIKLFLGKSKQVPPMLWLIDAFAILALWL